MASKFTKWDLVDVGFGGRGVITSYYFVGTFNYYGITYALDLGIKRGMSWT